MRLGSPQKQASALHRFPTRRLEQRCSVQQLTSAASQSNSKIQLTQEHQAAIVMRMRINPCLELRLEVSYEDHHVARTATQERGQRQDCTPRSLFERARVRCRHRQGGRYDLLSESWHGYNRSVKASASSGLWAALTN